MVSCREKLKSQIDFDSVAELQPLTRPQTAPHVNIKSFPSGLSTSYFLCFCQQRVDDCHRVRFFFRILAAVISAEVNMYE